MCGRAMSSAPRVHAELAANGIPASKNRVARLDRELSETRAKRNDLMALVNLILSREAPAGSVPLEARPGPVPGWQAASTKVPSATGAKTAQRGREIGREGLGIDVSCLYWPGACVLCQQVTTNNHF